MDVHVHDALYHSQQPQLNETASKHQAQATMKSANKPFEILPSCLIFKTVTTCYRPSVLSGHFGLDLEMAGIM